MLKQLILTLILLSTYTSLFSQNAIAIVRALRSAPRAMICRRITTPISHFPKAVNTALLYDNSYLLTNTAKNCTVEVRIPVYQLKSPTKIYGPYNMLRAVSSLSREQGNVAKRYEHVWKHINQTQGFNGAHHIINKSAIKLIHEDSKSKTGSYQFSLKEAQNNAPAIFHPLHGNPEYTRIFHNGFSQYQWYLEGGMENTLKKQLNLIQQLNIELGLPQFSDEMIEGIMTEGELWSTFHGLRWK
jgi:hypothetical protein